MKTTGRGVVGEQIGVDYLLEHGYTIRTRNFVSRFGEIDIIAERDGFLCFVEVKTRGVKRIADGREYVTVSKQEKLIKTAEYYITCNANYITKKDLQPRFDCIEIVLNPDDEPTKINHLENIF